ncbi:hypothetical protein Tco_0371763 [Tanacetum coccineum]
MFEGSKMCFEDSETCLKGAKCVLEWSEICILERNMQVKSHSERNMQNFFKRNMLEEFKRNILSEICRSICASVDVVFDGAFGRVRDEEVVVGEGVVVISSSLDMLTNNCLGGIMVSLSFLEGLDEEALVEFMVE